MPSIGNRNATVKVRADPSALHRITRLPSPDRVWWSHEERL